MLNPRGSCQQNSSITNICQKKITARGFEPISQITISTKDYWNFFDHWVSAPRQAVKFSHRKYIVIREYLRSIVYVIFVLLSRVAYLYRDTIGFEYSDLSVTHQQIPCHPHSNTLSHFQLSLADYSKPHFNNCSNFKFKKQL